MKMDPTHPRYPQYTEAINNELTNLSAWCQKRLDGDHNPSTTYFHLQKKQKLIIKRLDAIYRGVKARPLISKGEALHTSSPASAHWIRYQCHCGNEHMIAVHPSAKSPMQWQWNQSPTCPTVTGPIVFTSKNGDFKCHHHITAGNIEFLTDSTHHASGETKPMQFI